MNRTHKLLTISLSFIAINAFAEEQSSMNRVLLDQTSSKEIATQSQAQVFKQDFKPQQNKEYRLVESQIRDVKFNDYISKNGVIEFFSFSCGNCYNFEFVYHIPKFIQQNITGDRFFYVNVDALYGADDITKMWAVAQVLARDLKQPAKLNEAKNAIFQGFHSQSIKDSDAIMSVILNVFNIDEATFMKYWESNSDVENLTKLQLELTKKLKIDSTPEMLVNGKYLVLPKNFTAQSHTDFIQQYLETINQLSGKRDE